MRLLITIPTYWARSQGHRLGDCIYDHPTVIGEKGDFLRSVESLKNLVDRDFELLIIVATTTPEIEEQANNWVRQLMLSVEMDINIHIMSTVEVKRIKKFLCRQGKDDLTSIISLQHYPHVRNLSFVAAQILNCDAVIFIDDDEMIEDSTYLSYVRENLNHSRFGLAGKYLNADGDYLIKKELPAYAKCWGGLPVMNQTFENLIATGPDIKECCIALGGNMVVHKSYFTEVAFDPKITRGEDIDYVINCNIYNKKFYFDRRLAIVHLPPPKTHPKWRQLQEDIQRFFYERAKVTAAEIPVDNYHPYPGRFFHSNFEEIVKDTCHLLAQEYKESGDLEGEKAALENIKFLQGLSFSNILASLDEFMQQWRRLMYSLTDQSLREEVFFIEEKRERF